jgi:hypothetical protein
MKIVYLTDIEIEIIKNRLVNSMNCMFDGKDGLRIWNKLCKAKKVTKNEK